MSAPILEVSGLSKKFCRDPHRSLRHFLRDIGREICGLPASSLLRTDEFWAVKDVSFAIARGEVLGVIGRNGAGKSTLINLIAGVVRPTAGQVILRTKRVALMDHGGGLNAALTGRENIRKMLALHGCPTAMVPAKEEAAVAFAEIGAFIDAAVGTYSLGMRQRLAFAIYTQLDPDLFIADEALNGGDLQFQRKFSQFLKGYLEKGGSILLCSHDLITVQNLCPHSILMDHGKVVVSGNTVQVIDAYQKIAAGEKIANPMPQAVARNWTTSDRSGANEVRIDSASVQGGEFPGAQLVVEIRCYAEQAMDSIVCAVEIGNELHASLSTLVFGYPPKTFRLEAGVNLIRCRIDSLPLAAGCYQARIYIAEEASASTLATYGLENRPLEIVVSKPLDATSNIAFHRNNLVHIRGDWSVATHEP